MKFYCVDKKAALIEVKSSEAGLTSKEAEERLQANGKNKLAEEKKESIILKFFKSMVDPMIIILLVAAAISLALSLTQGESFADVFIILFVVVVNAVLGVVQENKAEQAIAALMEMTAATSKVIRDGEIVTVKSEDLVIGDVVVLEAGDSVPADCRILESHSMKVEEAALTGESVPVTKFVDMLMLREDSKDVPLGDRLNMVYSGSSIVYGRGRAVVVATGMDTEMGKIASALKQAETGQTPLQIKMTQLSKVLTWLVLGICVAVFVIGIIKAGSINAAVVLNTFMLAVSLAVAAIPEGLVAVVTIVLSIGVTKMSKNNAVIRKLTAVETLGCTQVICSDKTGTLTQNRMTVVDTYTEDHALLAKAMAMCSDATRKAGMTEASGEPTECALVNHAHDMQLYKEELDKQFPRVGEAPFDSGRKMMSTIHKESGRFHQYTKGACEIVLDRCTSYIRDGQVLPMTEAYKIVVRNQTKDFASRALRVLGAAFKVYDNMPDNTEAAFLEKELTFIGFVGMIDPCRPEVYDAIKECRGAGIRPIMITGDHKDTAVAIAKDLGIITDASQAIEGASLEDFTDEKLIEAVDKYSVYARVQPEHKTRIVKAWKSRGMVTAMTGDGVNDAPSIKAADIGVGMGITGTAVTKGVSDMVLADDNFATIVKAVEEGRKVYDNIRKTIQFLLSSNIAEVFAIFIATILGFTILLPVHILWVNLVTDCFPALALGMEKGEPDIMKRKPRGIRDSVFSNGIGGAILYQGIIINLLVLAAYFIGHYMETGIWEIAESPDGVTMAFLTLCMVEIFHSFNLRSLHGSILTLPRQNWWLFGSFALAMLLTAGVIFVRPIAAIFSLEHISLSEYLVSMALSFSIIPIVEIIKFFQRQFITKNTD